MPGPLSNRLRKLAEPPVAPEPKPVNVPQPPKPPRVRGPANMPKQPHNVLPDGVPARAAWIAERVVTALRSVDSTALTPSSEEPLRGHAEQEAMRLATDLCNAAGLPPIGLLCRSKAFWALMRAFKAATSGLSREKHWQLRKLLPDAIRDALCR